MAATVRTEPPSEPAAGRSCDAGGCDEPSVGWRWFRDMKEWLPCCDRHMFRQLSSPMNLRYDESPAPTERKHPAVSTENPISDLVNAALNGGDTPDDGSEHRPELASAYNLLYGTPVLVELVTGEAQRPTMGTAIRIVNALADAGLLNVAGGRSGDR